MKEKNDYDINKPGNKSFSILFQSVRGSITKFNNKWTNKKHRKHVLEIIAWKLVVCYVWTTKIFFFCFVLCFLISYYDSADVSQQHKHNTKQHDEQKKRILNYELFSCVRIGLSRVFSLSSLFFYFISNLRMFACYVCVCKDQLLCA